MAKAEAFSAARERDGERSAATLDELFVLRRASPAWRLLAADSSPAVVAFLDRAFLSAGNRTVAEAELASVLTAVLDEVNASDGPAAMPKSAREYLSDWCGDGFGWLRRYYAPGSDEPVYDVTPRAEAAVVWVKGLSRSRAFIGTQSRLLQVIDLLDQIAEGVQDDPAERIRILEQRRAEIDEQIEAARGGRLQTLGAGEVRDRYQTLADLARSLLADFRHVEENFRTLDRQTREQVAQWNGPRSQLLDQVLGQRHFITEGETGASFTGFYDVLFDPSRWENLQRLLGAVAAMPEVSGVDDELPGITRDWLRGADQVQRTVARLSAQMRRFLEEQAYAENRRIGSLVHSIEANAVAVRDDQPRRYDFMSLDEPRADVGLPMDRILWAPPIRQRFADPKAVEPPSEAEIETMDELFAGQHVDAERVRAVLAATLSLFPAGLSVKDAVDLEPLTEGLAELVTLLEVATDAEWLGEVDETMSEQIVLVEPDRTRVVTVPRMVLTETDGEVEGDGFG